MQPSDQKSAPLLSLPGRAGAKMHINVTPASDDERGPMERDDDFQPSSLGSPYESDDTMTIEEEANTKKKVRRRMQRNRSASIAVPGLDLQNSISDSEMISGFRGGSSHRRGSGIGGPRGPLFARRGSNCSDVDDRADVEAAGGLAASIAAFRALRQRRASLGGAVSPTQEPATFDLDELVERIKAKETVEFEVSPGSRDFDCLVGFCVVEKEKWLSRFKDFSVELKAKTEYYKSA